MIALNKILTTSAKDWIDCNSTSEKAYEFIGVHLDYHSIDQKFLANFMNKVPSNAEVVVDFKIFMTYPQIGYAVGTALVPKVWGKDL